MAEVEIEGMAQFQKALDKIQSDFPREMKDAANQVAKDWMNAAKNKARGHNAKEVAGALVVTATNDGAKLSNSHVLFYGEEFGGRSRPETMQFPPHVGQRGYFVFPAARENAGKFQKLWEAGVDEAMKPWNHKE